MKDRENAGARVALVVLGAGAGTRWRGAGHKLDALLPDGRTVLETSLGSALEAARELSAPLILVTGENPPRIAPSLAEAVVIHSNPQWRDGQRTSVLAGLDRARREGANAAVIGLGDQPFVTARAWVAVARCDSPIAVAVYDGRRANPVRVAGELWDEVGAADIPADEGLRTFISLRPELVEEVPCDGSPFDIDTVEDLDRWT